VRYTQLVVHLYTRTSLTSSCARVLGMIGLNKQGIAIDIGRFVQGFTSIQLLSRLCLGLKEDVPNSVRHMGLSPHPCHTPHYWRCVQQLLKATRVVAWLGTESVDDVNAFQYIKRYLSRGMLVRTISQVSSTQKNAWFDSHLTKWKDILNLCNRRY
jgi:hypothetical protein